MTPGNKRASVALGALWFTLAGFAAGALATQEELDDDICQRDEVRAEIATAFGNGEHDARVRCLTLDEYMALEDEGRLLHD